MRVHAAAQDHRISQCRHARLRQALQFQGPNVIAEQSEDTSVAHSAHSPSGWFGKWAGSLMLVAFAYFFFASLVAVDYSAWEEPTDSGEIAICQTAEDGRVTIVTIPCRS